MSKNLPIPSLTYRSHSIPWFKTKWIVGSITGETFSAIHGDLFTELFNKETKGTAGPFCSGFSTSTDTVKCRVNAIHINTL